MSATLCIELGCPYAALHQGRCAIHGDATASTCIECDLPVYASERCVSHYNKHYRARKRAEQTAAAQ